MSRINRLIIESQGEFVAGKRENVTISEPHQRIHDGLFFSAGVNDPALANGASLEVLFRISGGAHVTFYLAIGGDATFQGFENTVVSADGTSVPVINRNRFTGNGSANSVFDGPTITNDGDLLLEQLILGGDGGQAAGGAAAVFLEWVLDDGDHLIRLTNDSGQVRRTQLLLDWYERPT